MRRKNREQWKCDYNQKLKGATLKNIERGLRKLKSKGVSKHDAWMSARAAKTDFDKAYAGLITLSKRLNRLIQDESPELIRSTEPPVQTSFGFVKGKKTKGILN